MSIAWPEDLTLGIALLDAQHRELYERVNALLEAMHAGRHGDVGSLLHYLHDYAREHFRAEEELMRAQGYPQAERHAELHLSFAAALEERMQDFRERGPTASLAVDMSAWLTDWLRDHLRRADVEMGRWVKAQGEKGGR